MATRPAFPNDSFLLLRLRTLVLFLDGLHRLPGTKWGFGFALDQELDLPISVSFYCLIHSLHQLKKAYLNLLWSSRIAQCFLSWSKKDCSIVSPAIIFSRSCSKQFSWRVPDLIAWLVIGQLMGGSRRFIQQRQGFFFLKAQKLGCKKIWWLPELFLLNF